MQTQPRLTAPRYKWRGSAHMGSPSSIRSPHRCGITVSDPAASPGEVQAHSLLNSSTPNINIFTCRQKSISLLRLFWFSYRFIRVVDTSPIWEMPRDVGVSRRPKRGGFEEKPGCGGYPTAVTRRKGGCG